MPIDLLPSVADPAGESGPGSVTSPDLARRGRCSLVSPPSVPDPAGESGPGVGYIAQIGKKGAMPTGFTSVSPGPGW
jgi:hypothetical protein